jgi:hypothetical protein
VVFKKRSRSEVIYIAKIFARTGLVVATWFGVSGLALHTVSDRVLLNCERGEESIPACKLTIERLFDRSTIKLPSEEIQQISSQGIHNKHFPSFVQWQMEIATTQGKVYFDRYNIAKSDEWEDFRNRTNKFLATPQIRSFTITSEHNFWFKFISQSISGISILCGLFIVPGLYLTAKYGSDIVAQQQAMDGFMSQFTRAKSSTATR